MDIDESIGRRPYMEDRHIIEPNFWGNWSLFAVCDGHGGSYTSHFLKFHYKDILRQCMIVTQDIDEAIQESFHTVTKQLDLKQALECGSTFTGILLRYPELISINVGDSRCVMGNPKNKYFEDLTKDHKPSDPTEINRIYASGGFVEFDSMNTPRVLGNLALSRAVGDLASFPAIISTPDIRHFNISKYKELYIAVASDGIWDVQTSENVIMMLDAGLKCRDIVEVCSNKGSSDNMTLLSLHIST